MFNQYKSYLAVLGSLIVIGGFVVGAYHEFCTVREHKEDLAKVELEVAGVSLFQQQISTQQQIKWLENDLRELYKQHGRPPYSDPNVQADYEELIRKLEDERKALLEIRKKIKK